MTSRERMGTAAGDETRRRVVATTLALVAVLALYGAWQLSVWPAGGRGVTSVLWSAPAGLAAVAAALWAVRRSEPGSVVRSVWAWLAAALAFQLLGSLLALHDPSWRSIPLLTICRPPFLAFYLAPIVGLLRFLAPRRRSTSRARLALDLAIVALSGGLVLGWVMLSGNPHAGFSPLQRTVLVAFPAADLILLVAIGSRLLRGVHRSGVQRLLAVAMVLYIAADLRWIEMVLRSQYTSGSLLNALCIVAIAVSAIACAAQSVSDPSTVAPRESAPALGWAPYVAMTIGFGLLIIDHRSMALVIATVVLGAVVGVRQLVASGDLLRAERLASHRSTHDALTGLPNRRALLSDLAAALEDGADAPLMLAMYDLDGFKHYNDRFGHMAGDQLLRRIGQRMQAAMPAGAHAYRLGGDEFCAIVSDRDDARRLIEQVADEALTVAGPGFTVGASAGTVRLPEEAADVMTALHIADTRMYAGKHGRRSAPMIAQLRDVLMTAIAEQCAADRRSQLANLGEQMLGVGALARGVARRLGLGSEEVELATRTGELHDIGKIAIPESILAKSAPLSDAESRFVHQHTVIGQRVLGAAAPLRPVAALVRSTHERFDGGGYPDGLRGEQIPRPSRIVFACDAYLAMIAPRPYASVMTEAQARQELRRCAGNQFDPDVVAALLAELAADARVETRPHAGSVSHAGSGERDPQLQG